MDIPDRNAETKNQRIERSVVREASDSSCLTMTWKNLLASVPQRNGIAMELEVLGEMGPRFLIRRKNCAGSFSFKC